MALDAQVTTASGRRYTQPGFFMVRHRRVVRGGVELMTPVDHGGWYVRLAATEPGPLRVRLVARDRTGTVSRNVGPFQVQASRAKGFLRPSRVDPRYLQFDSGAPFVPVGHNVPIYHTTGQTGIDAIRKMAANGENFDRWWLSNAGRPGVGGSRRLVPAGDRRPAGSAARSSGTARLLLHAVPGHPPGFPRRRLAGEPLPARQRWAVRHGGRLVY